MEAAKPICVAVASVTWQQFVRGYSSVMHCRKLSSYVSARASVSLGLTQPGLRKRLRRGHEHQPGRPIRIITSRPLLPFCERGTTKLATQRLVTLFCSEIVTLGRPPARFRLSGGRARERANSSDSQPATCIAGRVLFRLPVETTARLGRFCSCPLASQSRDSYYHREVKSCLSRHLARQRD
jgi:hypothetical protein